MADVAGLRLDEALRVLGSEGVAVDGVETAAVPDDFRRRGGAEDDRPLAEYVAAQKELPNGAVRLVTVKVPDAPKKGPQ